ncbi:MAG TPA: diacylglycerol kinase [Methylotenera sp.]
MKGQSFYKRLGFAINGIRLAFFRERSFRYHVVSCAGVLLALLLTRPAVIWWAIGALTIGLVVTAELINTAMETLADHVHPEHHNEIKAVKDIAAAAVLISSITAFLVAVAFLFYYFQT